MGKSQGPSWADLYRRLIQLLRRGNLGENERTEARDVTRNANRSSMTLRNMNVHANPI